VEIESFPTRGQVAAVDASMFPPVLMLRDANGSTAEYPMAGNVVITVIDADGTPRVLTPQQWQERIAGQVQRDKPYYETYDLTFVEETVVGVRLHGR
jgi:hypothetical protein